MAGRGMSVPPEPEMKPEVPEEPPAFPSEEASEEPPTGTAAESGAGADADADYHDRWLRAEAELQNFRRRAQREREESARNAEEAVLLELVHVVDDLERAIEAAQQAAAPESWTQGVKLVAQRVLDYLSRQGVHAVQPLGQPFDPRLHEALLELPAPEGFTPGQVTQVVQKGYRRGPRALRAARVVVASPPKEDP